MATTTSASTQSILDSLNKATTAQAAKANQTTTTKPKGGIGKDEFLTMLVTQLKNQDPLDPMSNEDFAVNLAQFSSLEQLISINDKVTDSSKATGDISSYASFLGKEVSVKSDDITVEDNAAGTVNFSLDADAISTKVDILNSDGSVAKTIDAGALGKGRQRVDLKDLGLSDGNYNVRVTATGASGSVTYPETNVGGVVTGFVPGDSPTLLVGAKEIAVADVSLVQSTPPSAVN